MGLAVELWYGGRVILTYMSTEIFRNRAADVVAVSEQIRSTKNTHTESSEASSVPLNHLELSEEELRAQIVKNLDAYIEGHFSGIDKTLRKKQMSVFIKIRDFIAAGGREGYIVLPPGSGKTVIFSKLIKAANIRTLVTAPTQILIDQTVERLEQFASKIPVGKFYQHARELSNQVTVTTYASLVRSVLEGIFNTSRYALLILDEAHKGLTSKRKGVIRKFKSLLKLGFTATPEYSEKKKVSNLLGTEIYRMSIREASEEGMLTPYSVIAVRADADMRNVRVSTTGDYEESSLSNTVNTVSRNRAAIDVYRELFKGQSAIAFCVGIEHSHQLAQQFRATGIKAEAISGKTPFKKQKELKDKFAAGEIDILCNADLLTIGFDEPRTSVCLNLRPTRSKVMAEQRAGRTMRLDPENPYKHATIVEFLDKNYSERAVPIFFTQIGEGAAIGYADDATTESEEGQTQIWLPDMFKEDEPLLIGGHEVVLNPGKVEELLDFERIVSEAQRAEYERKRAVPLAPVGWMTTAQVVGKYGGIMNFRKIKEFAEKYRAEFPDYFEQFRFEKDNPALAEFYSPELVALIEEEVRSEVDYIPEGWRRAAEILASHPDNFRLLKMVMACASEYRGEHPEWFEKFNVGNNAIVEHYSPELVSIIEQTLGLESEASVRFLDIFRRLSGEKNDERKEILFATAIHKANTVQEIMMLAAHKPVFQKFPSLARRFLQKVKKMKEQFSYSDLRALAVRTTPETQEWIRQEILDRRAL